VADPLHSTWCFLARTDFLVDESKTVRSRARQLKGEIKDERSTIPLAQSSISRLVRSRNVRSVSSWMSLDSMQGPGSVVLAVQCQCLRQMERTKCETTVLLCGDDDGQRCEQIVETAEATVQPYELAPNVVIVLGSFIVVVVDKVDQRAIADEVLALKVGVDHGNERLSVSLVGLEAIQRARSDGQQAVPVVSIRKRQKDPLTDSAILEPLIAERVEMANPRESLKLQKRISNLCSLLGASSEEVLDLFGGDSAMRG